MYNNASTIATTTTTDTTTKCTVHFNCYIDMTMKAAIFNCIIFDVQSKSVITNSSGPAIFVRYTRGLLKSIFSTVLKWPIWLKNLFATTECSLTTEFVITGFHCISEWTITGLFEAGPGDRKRKLWDKRFQCIRNSFNQR